MARTGKNIYKRKDGRYEGRYIVSHDEDGKAKYASVYGKTAHEVEAVLIEKRAEIMAEEMQGITTYDDAAKAWLADRRGKISEASVDRYEYLLGKYMIPAFGKQDINDVTMVQIDTYIASLADKEKHNDEAIGGTTIENVRMIAGAVLAYAQKRGRYYPGLSSMVEIEKESYDPLTSEEIRKLVACARYNKSPEMLGVMLSLFCGIGTGELCALSWDDFDLERREISITHTLYRIRNKDGEDGNKTKLTVTNVRKSAVRVLQYPEQLQPYIDDFYHRGCVMLTGEKDRYLEQRTFSNHLEKILKTYNMEGLTLLRVKKTFDGGLSDVRYLTDPYYIKQEGEKAQIQIRVDERWLIKEMENDLLSLRNILGISAYDMGTVMGMQEKDYKAIEAGEIGMDWDMFLSFLFFFKYNSKTEPIVDALGLYPNALRERIGISR